MRLKRKEIVKSIATEELDLIIKKSQLSRAIHLKEKYKINDRFIVSIIHLEEKLDKLYELEWEDDYLTGWIQELETGIEFTKQNMMVEGVVLYDGRFDDWKWEVED